MKNIIKLCSLIALIGLGHQASAEPVPIEMRAFYQGKGTSASTDPTQPKEKSIVTIGLLNENDAVISTTDLDGNPQMNTLGVNNYLPQYSSILLRFDIAPEVFYAGSLRVSGKPGKRRLSGTLNVFQAGFGGLNFVKVKVKQLPPT